MKLLLSEEQARLVRDALSCFEDALKAKAAARKDPDSFDVQECERLRRWMDREIELEHY